MFLDLKKSPREQKTLYIRMRVWLNICGLMDLVHDLHFDCRDCTLQPDHGSGFPFFLDFFFYYSGPTLIMYEKHVVSEKGYWRVSDHHTVKS